MGSHPTRNRKFQKNSEKIQKIRKHHHSFISIQKKLGKVEKEREKKNRSNWFQPDPKQKIPKKQQKNSKNLKTPSQLIFKPKQVGKRQEREKKRKNSFQWDPTRPVIENSKKIAKKLKNLENTYIATFQSKIGSERPRKRERKKKSF